MTNWNLLLQINKIQEDVANLAAKIRHDVKKHGGAIEINTTRGVK